MIGTEMKVKNGYKKERRTVIIILLALLSFFSLAHFLSIYPRGYSIKKQSGEVLIGKGADIKVVTVNDNVQNELKIASLESRIAHLKTIWYVGLLFTATTILATINFKKLKLMKIITITASMYVVMAIVIIFTYANTLIAIENSISSLIN